MVDNSISQDTASATSNRLFEEIGYEILSGGMAPGMKLTEADLAKRYSVNRAPLREALLRLEERQLVERIPYSGTRVARLNTAALEELFEIREVLEGLACRKAATMITEAQLGKLYQILRESEERIANLGNKDARGLPAIGDFHAQIAEIAGSKELQRLLGREIWQFCRVNYQKWSRTPERLKAAALEHLRIVEALESRDPELAEILMRRHIAKARRGIIADLLGGA